MNNLGSQQLLKAYQSKENNWLKREERKLNVYINLEPPPPPPTSTHRQHARDTHLKVDKHSSNNVTMGMKYAPITTLCHIWYQNTEIYSIIF